MQRTPQTGGKPAPDPQTANNPGTNHAAHLHEPMIGLLSAAQVCAYWLRRDKPDLDELRKLVTAMVGRAETLDTIGRAA